MNDEKKTGLGVGKSLRCAIFGLHMFDPHMRLRFTGIVSQPGASEPTGPS